MIGIKEDLLLWFINFFDKKSPSLPNNGANINLKRNEQLAKELHKPIIKNF